MSQNTRPSSSSSNNILTLCIGILLALLAVWNCKVEAAQIRQFNKNLEGKQLQNKHSYESAHPESGIAWENLPVHDENFNNFINKHTRGWWQAGNNKVFTGRKLKDVQNRGSHLRRRKGQPVNNNYSVVNSKIVKISNYSIPPAYSLLEDPKFSSCKQLSLIRDEQQCGCWAFVVAEVVSDRFCVSSKTKVNEVLSPQYLISCDSNNGGCSYGYFDTAFQFVENQGIVTENCFPFVSGEGNYIPPCPKKCLAYNPFTLFKVNNSRAFLPQDIQGMQLSIMNGGSLAASLDIYRDFVQYRGGVYRHLVGNYMFTHSVRIVGWGITSPQQGSIPYWICGNNWTEEWGMQGWFWILRGSNECNIELDVWETTPIIN